MVHAAAVVQAVQVVVMVLAVLVVLEHAEMVAIQIVVVDVL